MYADETPHRMLEQWGVNLEDQRKSWYLWGFSDNSGSSYFEVHNTRSGDVSIEVLKDSQCEYLVSDVFSGYSKSVKETNKIREQSNQPHIYHIYCRVDGGVSSPRPSQTRTCATNASGSSSYSFAA